MILEFFKQSKPKNSNNTKDIDPTYLYKIAETEFDEDDPESIIKSVKKVDKQLGELDGTIVAIPKN